MDRLHTRLVFLHLTVALAAGCAAEVDVGATTANVIYGEDDRREYYELDAEERRFVRESVVALVPTTLIDDSDPEDVDLTDFTPVDDGICRDHPYATQPFAAGCSGTLIDDDLVLTAGHCLRDGCGDVSVVFDFYYTGPRTQATVTTDAIYGCEEVVVHRDWDLADWAIIRLDRPVDDARHPAPVAEMGTMPEGMPVASSGFPFGVPAKTSNDVIRESASALFTTHLDVSTGASGSGVIDPSGLVVGVLANGPDEEERATCETEALLEDADDVLPTVVYYAAPAVRELCASGHESARLCDPDFVDPRDVPEAPEETTTPTDTPADGAPTAPVSAEPVAASGCAVSGPGSSPVGWPLAISGLVGLLAWRRRHARSAWIDT